MKKRLKGLLALTMVACMMLAATTGIASAADYYMYVNLPDGGYLHPGDEISTTTGIEFALCDKNEELISVGGENMSIYDASGQVITQKCFGSGGVYTVSIPSLPGYEEDVAVAVKGTFSNLYKDNSASPGALLNSLYLKRIPIDYFVNYDPNTGTGDIDGTPFTVENLGKLSDGTGFTKDGMVIKSWNTAADGRGTSYAPGANIPTSIIDLTNHDHIITLYAQWGTPTPTDDASDKSPATGDSDGMMAALLLMAASAVAGAFLFRRRSSQH
ncbi:MAG: InlB B-repeat-containing protein [Bacillota bacterium]|nr:InlB B-repeat-containing protein [Bacillota bacterium]